MANIQTLVNKNENVIFREIYRRPDFSGRPNEYLLEYLTAARHLIHKYETEDWKHSINHHRYVFREYQICTLLHDFKEKPRENLIEVIAAVLSINPILLFNDPDLPF